MPWTRPHPSPRPRPVPSVSSTWIKRGMTRPPPTIVGVDLAGSPRRETGICILHGLNASTRLAYGDGEILHAIHQAAPSLVTIDAPLTLPQGRSSIHDRSGEHFRPCDLELRRRKIKFFPMTLGPMRMLTERGLALRASLERLGYRVVECYPGAAQDIWRIPRQHQDLRGLLTGLTTLGVRGLRPGMTGDELDAVTAAAVGRWLVMGRGEWLGGEGGILVPIAEKASRGRPR